MCISDPKTLVALRALRTQLTQLMNASFRNPGRPWTQEQIDVFKIAAEVLGLGANDRDRALQL